MATLRLPVYQPWITDERLHPEDTIELATEALYHLPRCCLCYLPSADAPEVNPGHYTDREITFGCFNSQIKISPQVIELWNKVLLAVPESKLLLKSRQMADQALQRNLLDSFSQHGITGTRLVMMPHTKTFREHLDTYRMVEHCSGYDSKIWRHHYSRSPVDGCPRHHSRRQKVY